MNCPNCHEPVETGAAYCGNCGQPLQATATVSTHNSLPNYALATPAQHKGAIKASLSLLFGITGLVGSLFMALIGLVFGVAGLVMGTMAHSSPKRALSTTGLMMSSLAVVASLGVWVYVVKHEHSLSLRTAPITAATPSTLAADLTTPCYSAGFIDKLNVTSAPGSCNVSAFNGETLRIKT